MQLILKSNSFLEIKSIQSKKGKEGGTRLGKNLNQITIAEIYNAVKNSEVLGKKNQHPNPKCEVGKVINQHLDLLFSETDEVVMNFLKEKSLKNFIEQFK